MDRQITPAFSVLYRVSSLLGWFRASLASLHFVRISLQRIREDMTLRFQKQEVVFCIFILTQIKKSQ